MRYIAALLAAGVLLGTSATSALAATVNNGNGQSLTVATTTGLKPSSVVKVSGKGFSPRVGIYVALCVVVPKSQLPTPCGGGVNMSGKKPSSLWISSNPPPYGKNLAIPFGKGGTFSHKLTVSPKIGNIDCRVAKCAIYTRADHLASTDRSFDVAVPVTFK